MDNLFHNLIVKTVTSDYSWDKQSPTEASVTTSVVSGDRYIGYAPFVSVLLSSYADDLSGAAIAFSSTADYGDYYNSRTSTQTIVNSGIQVFCHNYIMPGLYSFTLTKNTYAATDNSRCLGGNYVPYDTYVERGTQKQERLHFSWMWYNFFKDDYDERTKLVGSFEPRNELLTWEECVFQGPSQVTWDQAVGPAIEIRNSPVSWQWKKIKPVPEPFESFTQNTTWASTKPGNLLPRTWKQIKTYKCGGEQSAECLELVPTLSTLSVTHTLTGFLEVLEIPPVAYLHVEHTKTLNERVTPYTVTLSPKFTRSGSFPIEKIIWDLGDGSPLIEKSRNNPSEEYSSEIKFDFSDEFGLDYLDPRNYDLVYTYNRIDQSGNCFYPSLTAISSSTGTSDCASSIVGPIKFKSFQTSSVRLTQNYLNDSGHKAYVGNVDNNVVFWNRNK